jgi:hypothetical protein
MEITRFRQQTRKPVGLRANVTMSHGPTPVAKICRRSAAQQGRGFRRDICYNAIFDHT